MKYRSLGRSGLKVSELCLGSMMFGGQTDEPTSKQIIGRAREQGVNFIDTADVYNEGRSEEVVGRAVAADRDNWIIATKVANPMGRGPNNGGLSRKWVLRAAEDSLRRLGIDYIDIYYLHRDDFETPLAETVRALGDLIAQGKIRYFGVSNFRAWRLAEICRVCDDLGVDRPVVSQPAYNAMNRTPEIEHLPACDYYGLGVAPYSPLARGVLTGKYEPGADPSPDSRAARQDRRLMQTEFRTESMEHARAIKAHAAANGTTATAFAVQWVLNNATVSSVIAGPRTIEQWDDYLAALDYRFTAQDEALVDTLVVAGHPSTPGYNDPAYPVVGRRARVA